MSAEATGWVWKHSPFSGSQLLVHLAIGDVVNDLHDNELWMSTETLARKAKVSRSTVTDTLRCLVESGGLDVLEAGGATRRPTRYRFQFTSALTGPPSAVTDSTRPDSARDTKEPKREPKGASAISGLARSDCPQCLGAGSYFSGAGFDRVCPCTERAQ